MSAHRSLAFFTQSHIGPIPICEGDAFGESIRIKRRFGSSGLNLACEGLLWGLQSEALRESPTELQITHRALVNDIAACTFIHFPRRDNPNGR
jgi:hypothetical protein